MVEKYWGEKKLPAKKGAQPNGSKPEKHIAVHENKIYYYASCHTGVPAPTLGRHSVVKRPCRPRDTLTR